jgi:hypothetical protein
MSILFKIFLYKEFNNFFTRKKEETIIYFFNYRILLIIA